MMSTAMLATVCLVAVQAAQTASATGTEAKANPPNIMFVLADDLGYNELNFMNDTRGIITPNLDALANKGVILRNYYVQPICSPTRSAFMTGRYTIRLGTQSNVIFWDTPWGIDLNETFLPRNLKDAGYKTGMFGKWHLGMFKEAYTPAQRGFDEHMGYYQGCESAWTHVSACCGAGSPTNDSHFVCDGPAGPTQGGYDWFKTGPAPNTGVSKPDPSANNTNSADLIRDAGVDFLSRQDKATPWFLYLPFQNIHGPYTTQQKYFDMYSTPAGKFTPGEQTMFGYLTEMDDAVGHVVAEMDKGDFRSNTVVIFSSDNGAPPASADVNHAQGDWIARNYPFRGHKAFIWEGGTRVAGFVYSPLLPAAAQGTLHHGNFHVTDWLPTIAGLAGASLKRNRALDGHDIWPAISTGGTSPRTEMLYGINPLSGGQAGAPRAGLRMGKYKVLTWGYNIAGVSNATETGPTSCDMGAQGDCAFFKDGPALFDLDADPSERVNLAKTNPQQLATLLARLKELADTSVEPMQWNPPYQGPDYYCADCPKHPKGEGPAAPWMPWL